MLKIIFTVLALASVTLINEAFSETIDGWTVRERGNGWNVGEVHRPTGEEGWFDLTKTFHSPTSMSISVDVDTKSNEGDFAALSKTFIVRDIIQAGADSCFLSFWIKDSYSGPTVGFYTVQAIADSGDIIYSKDVATDGTAWHHILADVSAYTLDTTNDDIMITLGIYTLAGAVNFPVEAYFDNIMFTYDAAANRMVRKKQFGNVKMTYAGMGNGRFDSTTLTNIVDNVAACKSNIYAYLFYDENSERNYGNRWQLYQEAALDTFSVNSHYPIDSWAYLVPPSEITAEKKPEPYLDDYNTWFLEFGGLSIEHDNLTAIVMDDFDSAFWNHSSTKLSIDNVSVYVDSLRMVNPLLPFVAVSYYDTKLNFISGTGENFPYYKPYLDAILFPYGFNSPGQATDDFKSQVETIRSIIGDEMPLLTDVYASKFKGYFPTPGFIRDVGQKGLELTDGLGIYQLQVGDNPETEAKRAAILELFSATDSKGRGLNNINSQIDTGYGAQ